MIVEPRRENRRHRLAEGWRRDEGKTLIAAAAGMRATADISDDRSLIEAALDLLEKLSVRSPFGIPEAGGGMHRGGNPEALELRPERIVDRMGKVVPFEKHRANECAAEARDLRNPAQLLNRVVHVL